MKWDNLLLNSGTVFHRSIWSGYIMLIMHGQRTVLTIVEFRRKTLEIYHSCIDESPKSLIYSFNSGTPTLQTLTVTVSN